MSIKRNNIIIANVNAASCVCVCVSAKGEKRKMSNVRTQTRILPEAKTDVMEASNNNV